MNGSCLRGTMTGVNTSLTKETKVTKVSDINNNNNNCTMYSTSTSVLSTSFQSVLPQVLTSTDFWTSQLSSTSFRSVLSTSLPIVSRLIFCYMYTYCYYYCRRILSFLRNLRR